MATTWVRRWQTALGQALGLGFLLLGLEAFAKEPDPRVLADIKSQPDALHSELLLQQARDWLGRDLELGRHWSDLAVAAARPGSDDELEARAMRVNLFLLASELNEVEPDLQRIESLVKEPDLARFGAQVLVLRGRLQILTRQWDVAEKSLVSATALARQLGDRGSEAKALHNHALLLIRTGQQAKAEPLLEASLRINEADEREREADANRHFLGVIARDTGNYGKALGLHRLVLEHGQSAADHHRVAHSANALGILYANLDQPDQAIVYFQQAAAAYELLSDRYSQAMALINVGNSHAGLLRWPQALQFLDQGLAVAVAATQPDAESLGLAERAKVLMNLRRGSEALVDARRALALAEQVGTDTRLAQATNSLGSVLLQSDQVADALPILRRAVELARRAGRNVDLAESLKLLAETEAKMGLYVEATKHLQEYVVLFDKNRDELAARQLTELNARHESERRDAELKTQQERIRLLEEQSSQQQRIRYWMGGGLVSLLFAIAALVSRFKNKQRAEMALRAHNQLIAKANTDLAEAANTDALTGARNRRYFQRTLLPKLEHAQASGQRFALILIDADQFKKINDEYGHDVGDNALVSLVGAWQQVLSPNDTLVRWGGEEFLAVLFESDASAVSAMVAAGLGSTRALYVQAAGQQVPVRASVGWIHGPQRDRAIADLLRDADQNLLRAKAEGRDRAIGPA
ncbi:MAG: GGDEF domain-containing protein [Ahniella sp.]|nr:GGDEF domain-containing protein [Ahniella sp.]